MNRGALRVTILSWRDRTHPEGGGAEHYLERIATGLVADGCEVTLRCAAVPGQPTREVRAALRIRRRGGRFGVYPAAVAGLVADRLRGRGPDVVIDVQNGVPFFSRHFAGAPVLVLCHHVHREQWPIALPGLAGRFGWWLESWLAPRAYRGCQYVTVSEMSRLDLISLGVDPEAILVVHNGVDHPPRTRPVEAVRARRLVVLGRLVPHKRVEHAIEIACALRSEFPGLRLDVIGDGWWLDHLVEHTRRLAMDDAVTFHGFVDDVTKHRLLAQADVMLVPSVKEGWGLMVIEGALHAVPAIAYRDAGGVAESVLDGITGLLVGDQREMLAATRDLLHDDGRRSALGAAARAQASRFTWREASATMLATLHRAAAGEPPRARSVAVVEDLLGGTLRTGTGPGPG